MVKEKATGGKSKARKRGNKNAKGGFVKKISRFLLKTLLFCFGGSILFVLIYRWVPVPFTPLMGIRMIENSSSDKFVFEKEWVGIENISSHLQLAVVGSEDQLFLDHFGFDIKAIEKALKNNNNRNRKGVKGASTISQQTAKNVFLWPGRNWLRKGLEVYFTSMIELLWSKERILEVYLNVIEMGDGIYGAEAAAQIYFKCSAKKLNSSQAALIAAILPNPRKYSAANPSGYIKGRQAWIMRQMNNLGKLDFEVEKPKEIKSTVKKKKSN